MSSQSAAAVGLIVPGFFGYNAETARTNPFQHKADHTRTIHEKALAELSGALQVYTGANVDVRVFKSGDVTLPDAIFPNSVITFAGADLPFGDPAKHYAILCPMLENSRQRERSPYAQFLQESLGYELVASGIFKKDIAWYELQPLETRPALEGTGSLALDRVHKIAYCALSPRSDKDLAVQLCRAIGYQLVAFNTENDIYHTDLVMCIGSGYAIICSEIILEKNREQVLSSLKNSGLNVYEVGRNQFLGFCLNSREIRNRDGRKFLFMSDMAYKAFGDETLDKIRAHGIEILHTPLDTIEAYGGGSGCCITQELHGTLR